MARKHTIFIGALFHVAIAMFKSDSSTLHNVVPASSLEPLSCTSQLPVAAARAWQRPGTGEAQHSKDCSGCLNLHLESSSHPFHGKKLLLSPVLFSLLKPEVSDRGCVLPPLQGWALQGSLQSDSCPGHNTAAALPRSYLKKLSYSGQKTPEPQINLWVN